MDTEPEVKSKWGQVWYQLLIKITKKIPHSQRFLVWNRSWPELDNGEPQPFRCSLTKKDVLNINFHLRQSCNNTCFICFTKPGILTVFSITDKKAEESMEAIYNMSPELQLQAIKKLDIH